MRGELNVCVCVYVCSFVCVYVYVIIPHRKFQLADWRLQPLSVELIKYAR